MEMLPATDGGPLTQGRVRLTGLTPNAFQHPLDLHATNSLKKIKGFDWLVSKFLEFGIERIEYARHMGMSVRIGPRQMPRIYGMLQEACQILDMPEPDLYVQQGLVNAFTSGHNNPYIIVQTHLLELMDEDEVMAVLGHELGHIKCGHVLYMTMARLIGPLMQMIGQATFGIGSLVGAGVESALVMWSRRAEFSADRAALLVMQDARPCVRMLLRLAGGTNRYAGQLDPQQFLNQARAYREGLDQSLLDRFYRMVAMSDIDHPASVERARALDEWIESQEYKKILDGSWSKADQEIAEIKVCPCCRNGVEVSEKFCPHCGTPQRKR